MTDRTTAEKNSSRNRLQSPKTSKCSSIGKNSGQKYQDANKSTTLNKSKNLSDVEKPSPTATSASATADEHRRNQQSSPVPDDEVQMKSGWKLSDVLDVYSLTESPRDLLSSNDELDSHVSAAKRKTVSGVASKQTDASGTSPSRTDLDHNDQTLKTAGTIGKLRRRLDISNVAQTASDVAPSSDPLGACPAAAAVVDSSQVAMHVDDILAESFPARERKSRRRAKLRSRPAAPERDLTWTENSATSSEECSNEIHDDATGVPRATERYGTWIADSSTVLKEHSDGVHDNVIRPSLNMANREANWIEYSAAMSVEDSDKLCDGATGTGQSARVVPPGPSTSRSAHDDRKLETPTVDANTDSYCQQRLTQLRSIEKDETEIARSPQRCTTWNLAVHSDTTDKPPSQSAMSPESSRSPSPPASSVLRNSNPRSPVALSDLFHINADDEDDFEMMEQLTDEQDAETAARKMHARWTEIADGYATMLARCRSYASNATMARRMAELRLQTDALMDAQKQLRGLIDTDTMRRMEAVRRRSDRLRRQIVTAGSEPSLRDWMIRWAESELVIVSKVAAALKLHCDDVASRKHDTEQCIDNGATDKIIGIITVVMVVLTSVPIVIWEEGRVAALSHTYAVKSPLVTMACPNFAPKSTPFRGPIPKLHYMPHSLTRPTYDTKRHPDPIRRFFHNTLYRQTDAHTDRQIVHGKV